MARKSDRKAPKTQQPPQPAAPGSSWQDHKARIAKRNADAQQAAHTRRTAFDEQRARYQAEGR